MTARRDRFRPTRPGTQSARILAVVLHLLVALYSTNAAPAQELHVLAGHTSARVHSLSFSVSGKLLVSSAEDNTVRLWDVKKGVPLWTHDLNRPKHKGFESSVGAAEFTPDGTKVVCVGMRWKPTWRKAIGYVRVLDAKTGKTVSDSFERQMLFAFDLSPDGQTAAVFRLDTPSWDYSVSLRSVKTGQPVRLFSGLQHFITTVKYSDTGKWLAVGGDEVIIFNPKTGGRERSFDTSGQILDLAFLGDDAHFATVTQKQLARLNIETGLSDWTVPAHHCRCLDFQPKGTLLASGGYDIVLRDARNGTERVRLRDKQWTVNSIAFSPDGTLLATGCLDSKIRIWTVKDLLSGTKRP
jgi:WD40 repeat protein